MSNTNGATVGAVDKKLEYMYSYNEAIDGQGEDRIGVHRVVRVTAKFIFVEALLCGDWTPEGGVNIWPWRKICGERIRRFSRSEVEQSGVAYIPKWYEPNLHLDPYALYEDRIMSNLPPCAQALGLRPRFTADDVRAAYRQLAKQCHPDTGGDAQRFVELQRNYELALSLVTR